MISLLKSLGSYSSNSEKLWNFNKCEQRHVHNPTQFQKRKKRKKKEQQLGNFQRKIYHRIENHIHKIISNYLSNDTYHMLIFIDWIRINQAKQSREGNGKNHTNHLEIGDNVQYWPFLSSTCQLIERKKNDNQKPKTLSCILHVKLDKGVRALTKVST